MLSPHAPGLGLHTREATATRSPHSTAREELPTLQREKSPHASQDPAQLNKQINEIILEKGMCNFENKGFVKG